MADKKKNIFTRLKEYFKGVILELKKVIWPSKDKLKSICAVVFVVIIFFAIILTAISSGAKWGLDKVGFYDQVDPTTTTTVAETTAATEANS